eukprot:7924927-Alexandrium_andersonii.AAC.1
MSVGARQLNRRENATELDLDGSSSLDQELGAESPGAGPNGVYQDFGLAGLIVEFEAGTRELF